MAETLGLDYDEIVILKEAGVAHGGVMALCTDELILTNKKIICLSRSMLGGIRRTFYYPLDQIKVFNGIPQVQEGKMSNGTASLDIYLLDGEEQFVFQSKNKQTISKWIVEINKLFNISSDISISITDEELDEDDSVARAFKEVGDSFKLVGRDMAKAFGIKPKNQKKSSRTQISFSENEKNNTIDCPTCGKCIDAESKFCAACGAPIRSKLSIKEDLLSRVCPKCGKYIPQNQKFCTECGTEVKTVNSVNITINKQIELLEKLKSLMDSGIISQEEFDKIKKDVL